MGSGLKLRCNNMCVDNSDTMKSLILLLIVVALASSDKTVITSTGPIKGTTLEQKKVVAFLGIPYAEPPVGSLRFAKPVPKSPWKETFNAAEMPPACIQATFLLLDYFDFVVDRSKNISEDCLYLNLWVPEGGTNLKPIMLFIHGGAFMFGSSNMKSYNGAVLSQHGDIIVATINYRLGTLGFFSGFIDEAAGSMGMYDQIMAIQWIKDNAKNFGGDPDNIVLFGESAGAFSVSMHTISPLSRNLFKRGILQSGSSYHPMFSDNNEIVFSGSQLAASILGCADDKEALKKDPKNVVDCMKSVPAEKFSDADHAVLQNVGMLVPRVGDDFLPVNPIDSFRKGDFKDTEILLGINRDEGSMLLTFGKPDVFGPYGENFDGSTFNETSAMQILQALPYDREIIQSYLDRVKVGSVYTYLNAITDLTGDSIITCGSLYEADFKSRKNIPVYFYLFDYRSASSPYAKWMGVTHFDEIPYVFGNPLFSEFTKYEEEFSKDIMDMWVAFAKTGNPSIPGGLEWPRYSYEDPKYFIISQKDRVGVRPDDYRCEAWRNFFRAKVDDDVVQDFLNAVE